MKTPSPAEPSQRADAVRPYGFSPLVAVVGPTAVGKTALALRLAEAIGGEIVSADSRQVYRGMDIGTAKATMEERARAPHHLLDLVDPDQTLGLAQFQSLAYATIDGILTRRRIPFLAGGTGQYVMAVVEGWQVPIVPPDDILRGALYREAEEQGGEALYARLQAIDPAAARKIDPRNVRRVIRALEVCLTTGRPISEQRGKSPPPYQTLMIGLTLSRPQLYRRIDERVEAMIEHGLEDEVKRLVAAGYGFDLPAMSGVGYGQFAPYLAGEATLAEVVQSIKRATRRFVRQQSNWFRLEDPRIHWLDAAEDPFPAAVEMVRGFLDSHRLPLLSPQWREGQGEG